MSESHRHQAQAYLDDAQVAMLALDELLDADYLPDKSRRVREAHNTVGRALKLAAIHSQLALCEALTAVAGQGHERASDPWSIDPGISA